MSKTTIIRILVNGIPLTGADVTFGTYLQRWVTTNEDGELSTDLEDDFAAAGVLAIKHESLPPEGFLHGSMIIEAGETYEVNIEP